MLLFALFLAGCGAIVLLLRTYDRRQTPKRIAFARNNKSVDATIDGIQPLRFRVESKDNAFDNDRRFRFSSKPFIAFSVVAIILEVFLAVVYPSLQLVMLWCICVHAVSAILRRSLVDCNNKDRGRWVFGWIVAGIVVVGSVLTPRICPPGVKIARTALVGSVVIWALVGMFLNIGGVPRPCRMASLLAIAFTLYSLSIGWPVNDHAVAVTVLVWGMLVGETTGRYVVQLGEAHDAREQAAKRRFRSSFNSFVAFSAVFSFLEICAASMAPSLSVPSTLCIVAHVTAVGARRYLCTFADQSRARWLFGWGWVIISVCTMAALAFAQRQHIPQDQLDTSVVRDMAAMWFLKLICLNVIGAPWLARWTMLLTMTVLHVCMPLFAPYVSLTFVAAMIVGEIVGSLWVEHREILQSCFRWRSLAFDDKAQERASVVNRFEKSYSITTTYCKVAIVLSALCFPLIGVDSLYPMAYWLVMLGLRVCIHHYTPREDKATLLGFLLVHITLLGNAVYYTSHPLWEDAPALIVAVNACFIAMIAIFGKLACLPGHYRQTTNALMLIHVLCAPSYSTLGIMIEKVSLVGSILVAELGAYTLEDQLRSARQTTDLRQKVLANEAQMKLIMDTALSATCIADQHMQIQNINPAMALMFGYTKKELVGQHIGILMMPSMAKQHHKFVEEFRRTGVSSIIGWAGGREVEGRHKDGHVLHLRLTINLAPDRTLFVASFLDLAAENERRELERNMTLVLDTTQSPMAMADARMRLTYVNQAMCTVFGYTAKELKGQRIGIVMDDSTWAEYQAAAEEFWETGKRKAIVTVGREIRGKRKDGRTLHLRLSLDLTANGKQFVASFQDMSAEIAQRKSEQKLKQYKLREMTKKRDIQKAIAQRFKAACAYLSHEIRNQLYPQSVVLDEMKDAEPDFSEYVDMILSANATVTTILSRVLDLAKWESGEFPVDKKLFPLIRLFKSIAGYATAKKASIQGLASVDTTWYVRADEHLLKQAATNLVSNASKFGQGRPLTIMMAFEQTSQEQGVVVVTVTDNGRGMTAAQLTEAMVPFGQIRKAGEAHSGTGLGLPLSKAMIVVGHAGSLELTSDGLGKGTTATMRVPVEWVNQSEPPRPESDPLWWVKPHPGVTADVLVVDDVKLNRMVTIRAAKQFGLTFHESANGEEAVERLHSNTYSMVFMDRQMPVMDGVLATEKARANGYTLPIVMTSGDTFEPSVQEELERRGMTAFLNKMAVPGTRHAMKKLSELKKSYH